MQREIQDAAYRYQRDVEDKVRIVVGVNDFVTEEAPPADLFQHDPGVGQALAQRILRVRASRDESIALRALDALERGARGRDNLVPLIVEAVDASVTLGEICRRLRGIFGTHQPSVTF
jgi:methylmalonyl-CoA mutase N-terminal domain/subunit